MSVPVPEGCEKAEIGHVLARAAAPPSLKPKALAGFGRCGLSWPCDSRARSLMMVAGMVGSITQKGGSRLHTASRILQGIVACHFFSAFSKGKRTMPFCCQSEKRPGTEYYDWFSQRPKCSLFLPLDSRVVIITPPALYAGSGVGATTRARFFVNRALS